MIQRMFTGLLALVLASAALADDGMWMPQQIPALSEDLKKLGLQMDPKQLADLTGFPMGAIVSLGGCSASFVSPEGLVATNHHCVAGALQYNSTAQNDILKNGFLAKTRGEEIQALPDARIYVTTAIDDVTGQILAELPAGTTDAERTRTITRRRRQMIEECERGGGKRCLVSSFFEGGQYLRMTQTEIRDVRLVYAPALGVGNFGDEIDNWMWPRHTGDFAFYRAYVGRDGRPADFSKNNVPYKPKHFLKISTRDLDADDLVLVVGSPGTTHRHAAASEFQNALQYELPQSVRYRTMLRDVLATRGKDSRDIALKNASRISSLENYLKKHTGTLEAFERDRILDERQRLDRRDRRALDAALTEKYKTASEEVEKILGEARATQQRDDLFTWLYTASPMLTQANHLYRLSVEKAKNDLDRHEDYTERNRSKLMGTLTRNRRNIEPGSDRAGLRLFLLEATKLPADQRIPPLDAALAATGRATPEAQVDALLDRIYASTQIGSKDAEERMVNETTQQLLARKDSMIDFAASLRTFGEQLDEAKEARAGAMSRLRPAMLDALRVARGGRLYPDANGTLRVGFGQVKGYRPRNAVWYQPQTDVRGVLEKSTEEEPFLSPPRLLDRARKREFGPYADPDLETLPVAFISTNVVTNGSSGSATLNAWGELCGLAFDSNWEGVGSDYFVNDDITRTIHVDSRYMLWVMDAVDDADNLLREMGIQPQL
jgi:Peptidase S46